MELSNVITELLPYVSDRKNLRQTSSDLRLKISQNDEEILNTLYTKYPGISLTESVSDAVLADDTSLIYLLLNEYSKDLDVFWFNMYKLASSDKMKYLLRDYKVTPVLDPPTFHWNIDPLIKEIIDNDDWLKYQLNKGIFYNKSYTDISYFSYLIDKYNRVINDLLKLPWYIRGVYVIQPKILLEQYLLVIGQILKMDNKSKYSFLNDLVARPYSYPDDSFITEMLNKYLDKNSAIDLVTALYRAGKYELVKPILKLKNLHPDWFDYYFGLQTEKPKDMLPLFWKLLFTSSVKQEDQELSINILRTAEAWDLPKDSKDKLKEFVDKNSDSIHRCVVRDMYNIIDGFDDCGY